MRDDDAGTSIRDDSSGLQLLALNRTKGTADQPLTLDNEFFDEDDDSDDDDDALDLQKPAALVRSPSKAAA
jgi:hypothetical protein